MLCDFVGFGALNQAFAKLTGGEYRRIFVVASQEGWKRFNPGGIRPFFSGREVDVYSEFSTNPEFNEILRGAARFRAFRPDLILTIGGGSAMDVAKVIKAEIFTGTSYDATKPESLKPSGSGPPLVAIATTAGSGSEATKYAVFYLGETKQSLSHQSLRPDMAIVDPELSYSLPPDQTAATGFDALSQSVEAYWSSRTVPAAQELAQASIKYILPNLYNAVHRPEPGNRYHMAQGAYLSGQAIRLTRTTLPHALAYHLTKRYGLPHGHAVALTLPYFFLLNMDKTLPVQSPLGAEAHYANMRRLFLLLGQENAGDALVFWRNLLHGCGLAPTLAEAGVNDPGKRRALVDSVDYGKMANHPVRVGAEVLLRAFSEG